MKMKKFWIPSILVVGMIVVGFLTSGRLLTPGIALNIFVSGGIFGVLFAVILSGAGLWAWARNLSWAKYAFVGSVIPAAMGFFVIGPLFLLADGPTHRFNDVTTNLVDVPIFVAGPAAGKAYPSQFVPWSQADFPDLATTYLTDDWAASFSKIQRAAALQPAWEVTYEDREAGIIQAVARSKLFRFEDDVIIRLSKTPEGLIAVDLRSKSRVGMGDRGANAARIFRYLADLNAS